MSRVIIIKLIKLYKATLSPYLSWGCRYQPTCSEYMMESVRHYGVLKGLFKGILRIARCHPWGGHGYDPVVPEEKESGSISSVGDDVNDGDKVKIRTDAEEKY